MNKHLARGLLVFSAAILSAAGQSTSVTLTLDPAKVVGRIDEKIYGHFLEHIYHACNGGLWGDLVWNRSFEESTNAGTWRIRDGCVVQSNLGPNQRLVFGDPAWRDYEFTLEAQKTGGNEGFLVLFRVKSDTEFFWCNFGGARNERFYLERGLNNGQRWRGVGQPLAGTIQTGQWYQIRARCEGPRLQVWLDGKPVADYTDDGKGSLSGRVGVGSWVTQVRYRQLKVTTLDGQILFSGLPEVLASRSVARHWSAYGPGVVALDNEQALNSSQSQQIIAEQGESGLQQTPLPLRKGDTVRGSLWARGEAPGGLVVRFIDGQNSLAELPLAPPSPQWREFPIEFTPPAGLDQATLQIGLRGKGRVWIDQVSLMPDSARATGGYRPDLLKAIADLRPPVIRWPGGSFSAAYRWKDGIGPQSKRGTYPRPIWDDQDSNSFGTDEFIAMCRKIGAEPLIVINIGHNRPSERADYIQEACDWVEYCNGPAASKWGAVRAAHGHPEPWRVHYWEIDNEMWGMGATNYAQAVNEFVPAMRKVDPSIKILACGSGGLGQAGRGQEFNRLVLERAARNIDYLSVHHYENPNRFAEGPLRSEEFFRELGRLIRSSRNPQIKIYCSEWNAQTTDWRTGLYAGGLLNVFERCSDTFEIGGPALFVRHVSAKAWDNAFINFDHRTWFPAPNYVVMKLWRDHYAPHLLALQGETAPLNVVAAKTADGQKIILKAVNPTTNAVQASLAIQPGFIWRSASLFLVAPGALSARNTLEAPHTIKPQPAEVRRQEQAAQFSLPPFSAAVLEIKP